MTRAALSTPAPAARSDVEPVESALLLVESDPVFAGELLGQLRTDGYRALHARAGNHARALARGQRLLAVLLGALESPRAALDLLAEIRSGEAVYGACPPHSPSAWPDRLLTPDGARGTWVECVPVLVLGHGGEQLELLRAFEMGADDFIAREHYSYLELRARLKALLRRGACGCSARLMRVGALEIDARSRQVRAAGAPVALSRLEYELLVQLARDPRRVCSKQELLGAVWGLAVNADTRTVDSHASRLRRKLEAAGAKGFVVNVWSVGYRLT